MPLWLSLNIIIYEFVLMNAWAESEETHTTEVMMMSEFKCQEFFKNFRRNSGK